MWGAWVLFDHKHTHALPVLVNSPWGAHRDRGRGVVRSLSKSFDDEQGKSDAGLETY